MKVKMGILLATVLALVMYMSSGGESCNGRWNIVNDGAEESTTNFPSASTLYCSCYPYWCVKISRSGSTSGSIGNYDLTCGATTTSTFGWICYLNYGFTTNGEKKGYAQHTIRWTPGTKEPHTSPANNSFNWSASGDAAVTAIGDANNGDILFAGACYVYGYAKVDISGIYDGEALVDGTINFAEGDEADDTVTVGEASFPINLSADVENFDKSDSDSDSDTLAGAVDGNHLKARGHVRGRAYVWNNASYAWLTECATDVAISITGNNGGTHADCYNGDDYVHPIYHF